MPEHKVLYRNSDGVKRTMITDDDRPGEIRVFTEVEMDRVLDSIKEAREVNALKPRNSFSRHLARVPMTVYEKSILEKWGEDDWQRWLNDPDNAAFRVDQGRVGFIR